MTSKRSWESASDSHDMDGSFTVITLKLVSQSFGKSVLFLQVYEETLCAVGYDSLDFASYLSTPLTFWTNVVVLLDFQ
ncbi:hypothetical protein E5288_WYG006510 [Bos mutus]|uniref:Uncharacterized protein n=1 Tax=Bos mutus TaxID=72004 RepID=A0A6B0RAX3_9CETA|nr:hypothetical protein [Bos mutus]